MRILKIDYAKFLAGKLQKKNAGFGRKMELKNGKCSSDRFWQSGRNCRESADEASLRDELLSTPIASRSIEKSMRISAESELKRSILQRDDCR